MEGQAGSGKELSLDWRGRREKKAVIKDRFRDQDKTRWRTQEIQALSFLETKRSSPFILDILLTGMDF